MRPTPYNDLIQREEVDIYFSICNTSLEVLLSNLVKGWTKLQNSHCAFLVITIKKFEKRACTGDPVPLNAQARHLRMPVSNLTQQKTTLKSLTTCSIFKSSCKRLLLVSFVRYMLFLYEIKSAISTKKPLHSRRSTIQCKRNYITALL